MLLQSLARNGQIFAVPKIVPTRQFFKCPLDRFGLRMAIALSDRD